MDIYSITAKKPIMSFGVMCFRYNMEGEPEVLMVRRKDSLGYVDFLRGKFNHHNDYQLQNIIMEMTQDEIQNIHNCTYHELWNKLWDKTDEKYDKKNMEKFNYVKKNKTHLFALYNKFWDEPEWGFPKGRRNFKENDFECSLREFEEETGYNRSKLIILKNLILLEETFTGSNLKSYSHKYFICRMAYNDTLDDKNYQKSEIGDMKWLSFHNAFNHIRYYNFEKKTILIKLFKILNNNHIY